MIERYKTNEAWWNNTYIEKYAWEKLEKVMKYNNVIKKSNYYNTLVKNELNE